MVNSQAVPNVKVSDPLIKIRLETLLANPSLQKNAHSVSFAKSLLSQFEQRNSLSQKQVDCIEKLEKQYDPTILETTKAQDNDWAKEYSPNKKAKACKIAKWYKDQFEQKIQPFYYQRTAENILNNPDYIPSRTDYDKMVNNKFSDRFLQNSLAPAKFAPSDIVCPVETKNQDARERQNKFPYKNGIVIAVKDPLRSVKGGRIYTIIATGTEDVFDIEERYLKKDRDFT